MLISEFARKAGLSTDTVRFYVRKGLLAPELGAKGGSNPYQIFSASDLETARTIRMMQRLGFSLREIAAAATEYHAAGMSRDRRLGLMRSQLARLQEKAAQLDAMSIYMRAKIAWLDAGQKGPEPLFGEFETCLPASVRADRAA